jgi:endonuclease YncB( thermonuclease family)
MRRWLFDRYGDGRPVAIVTDPRVGRDSKGRLQVYVERKTPAELQVWLLRYGLAKLDRSAGHRFRQFPRYWSAQQRAKKLHKGVWGGC